MYWHGDMHAAWMIVFWIAVIAGGALGLRYALNGPRSGDTPREDDTSTPEEIVKKRYARGEISRDELDRKLADLRR